MHEYYHGLITGEHCLSLVRETETRYIHWEGGANQAGTCMHQGRNKDSRTEREHWTDVYRHVKNERQSHNRPIVGNKFLSRDTIEGTDVTRFWIWWSKRPLIPLKSRKGTYQMLSFYKMPDMVMAIRNQRRTVRNIPLSGILHTKTGNHLYCTCR